MKSIRSIRRLLLVLFVSILLPSALSAQNLKEQRVKLKGTTPAQWRITWTKRPQTRATISWSTAENAPSNEVYYGTESTGGNRQKYPKKAAAQKNGQYSGDETLYYHHVTLKDLQPSTTYYFVMASGNDTSRELHFRTAPAEPQEFKFLSGGDSRSDPEKRREMNVVIRHLVQQHPDILALAHGGDYVENGRDLNQFSTWMSDHELTTTPDGRVLPIIPTRGNHESAGSLYQEIFNTPGGEDNYFHTFITPEFLLLTLNTTISSAGHQKDYLEEQLKEHRNVRWKVAQYHRPAYPGVKGPRGNKEDWVPLFEQYGLNLALENDGHVYKRTPPILDGEVNPNGPGVVYMGEGGLGVPQRNPREDRWYLQSPGTTTPAHHVILLGVGAKEITYGSFNDKRELIDQGVIPLRYRDGRSTGDR